MKSPIVQYCWCWQNISDILAELDLPRSGIQDITGVKYPKGFLEQADLGRMDDQESTLMFYYSGQIHIRKVLNDIQSNIHPPESLYNFPWSMRAICS